MAQAEPMRAHIQQAALTISQVGAKIHLRNVGEVNCGRVGNFGKARTLVQKQRGASVRVSVCAGRALYFSAEFQLDEIS